MLPSKRALTELIGSVYDAAGDPAQWETFLGRLAQVSRADSAALLMHNVGRERYTVSASWKLDPEASRSYQEYYSSIDVWAIRGRPKPAGYLCTSESLCRPQELASTEIYNDFLIRYGIVHGMFGVIENNASRWASLSLYRDLSSNEFQVSDLDTVNLLIPHIQRAFRLHFQLSESAARAEEVETALNLLSTGVIFVAPQGEIVQMNSRADDLLRGKDGLLLMKGKLSASSPEESRHLQAVIKGATRTSNGDGLSAGGTLLVSRMDKRPLAVTVAPLRNTKLRLTQRAAAILFISDPDRNPELPIDLLRRCYGLTQAEARLAMILLEGQSLKEAADISGVTHNTAKSQLKSIFWKTQVKRQGELIRLFLNTAGIDHPRIESS